MFSPRTQENASNREKWNKNPREHAWVKLLLEKAYFHPGGRKFFISILPSAELKIPSMFSNMFPAVRYRFDWDFTDLNSFSASSTGD